VMAWVAFCLTMYAGVTMVSNATFFSGKSFALGRSVPFWGILLVVAVFVFVSSDPPVVLFGLFVLYGLSVWVITAWRWNRARARRQPHDRRPCPRSPPLPPAAVCLEHGVGAGMKPRHLLAVAPHVHAHQRIPHP